MNKEEVFDMVKLNLFELIGDLIFYIEELESNDMEYAPIDSIHNIAQELSDIYALTIAF